LSQIVNDLARILDEIRGIITNVNKSFIEWISAEIAARGWSNNEFARRAGISKSLVSLVLNGQRPPQQVTGLAGVERAATAER
jgi:hypothetical protein